MILIKRSTDNQFYFNVTAGNNQVLVTSEMYKTKQAAMKGIDSLLTTLESVEIRDMTEQTAEAKAMKRKVKKGEAKA